MNNDILDRCLVVTFSTGERTEALSDLSFEKLGFKNREIYSDSGGLREKFFRLAEFASNDKEYDFFIQNDADRMVFDGVYTLIEECLEKKIDSAAGYGFDYLMNRIRGATPNFFSKRALTFLNDNRQLMPNVQKPLTAWGMAMKKSPDFINTDINTITNLHDFEQMPSKVCNTLLNRLCRNHFHLYDKQHLSNLSPPLLQAVQHAIDLYNKGVRKDTINYEDFSFLDGDYPLIENDSLESLYEKYLALYNEIKVSTKL